MDIQNSLFKVCCTCKEIKELSSFHKNSKRCIICARISNKKYQQNNAVLINERNRASYYRNKASRRVIQKKYEKKIAELIISGNKEWHAKRLVKAARGRAKRLGIPFDLSWKDIIIPDLCPALGIPLTSNAKSIHQNSVTLDRIYSNKGYTKDNVVVISAKANMIKCHATPEELMLIAIFYRDLK